MKNKATHFGHCQCCGSRQKLPNGVLSKHGYTVQWGFFSGTCGGSGAKPFEKDISLIEGYIAYAKGRVERIEAEINVLRYEVAPEKVWENVWVKGEGRFAKSHYEWRLVEYKQTGENSWEVNGRRVFHWHEEEKTFAQTHNQHYIDIHLEWHRRQLREYISWQQSRIHNWTPTELEPVND